MLPTHDGSSARKRNRGRLRHAPIARMVQSLFQSLTFKALVFGLIVTLCIGFGMQLPRVTNLVHHAISRNFRPSMRHNLEITKAKSLQINSPGLRVMIVPDLLGLKQAAGATQQDYGGLEIGFYKAMGTRVPWDFSIGPGPVYRNHKRSGYVQDDDYKNNPYLDGENGVELAKTHKCRAPAKLKNLYLPTCNPLHEFNLGSKIQSGASKIVGSGAFREVFSVTSWENYAFKEASFQDNKGLYSFSDIEQYMMDGVVSAAILPHPLFVDLYAFCSLSQLSEYMDHGDLEKISLHNRERCKPKPITLGPEGPLVSRNKLAVTQKLQYSLDMAEALALMHNHPWGVLTHNDIQLSQFLLSPNGRVKFNDFNRAEIVLFDEEHNSYCKYYNGPGPGDWRSPEEYHDQPLDLSIDVFSLANNFYGILTGVYTFPDICSFDAAGWQVQHGRRSYLDPRWKLRSYGEGRLLDLIHDCWHTNPDDRPTIGEVVVYLRQTLQKHLKREHKQEHLI